MHSAADTETAGVQVQFDNLWMSGGSRAASLQRTVGKYIDVLKTLTFNSMTENGKKCPKNGGYLSKLVVLVV